MKTDIPITESADSADALYYPTDVSPEEAFQAIGRLRKEARDEVDRLLQFLDKTDDYVSRELEENGDEQEDSDPAEDDGTAENSLGFLERHASLYGPSDGRDQSGSQTNLCAGLTEDLEDEHDGSEPENEGGEAVHEDDEPSLGWTVDGCMTELKGRDQWGQVVCDLEAECA